MLALIARMKPLPVDCNMSNVKPQPDFTYVLEVSHEAKPSPHLPAFLTNLTGADNLVNENFVRFLHWEGQVHQDFFV
jgi:hypothetical protein